MDFGLLITMLGPLLGKLAVAGIALLGLLSAYFFAKNKGKQEAEAKQAKEKAKVQEQVTQAVTLDAKVDAKVAEAVKKIDDAKPQVKNPDSYNVGDDFRF
jgi:hypothetical protein